MFKSVCGAKIVEHMQIYVNNANSAPFKYLKMQHIGMTKFDLKHVFLFKKLILNSEI